MLEPGRHYLPVKADFSNLSAALEETLDPRVLQPLADAAYEEICLSGRYSYRRLATQVDESLRELGASERPGRPLFARAAPRVAAAQAELTRRGARPRPRSGTWAARARAESAAASILRPPCAESLAPSLSRADRFRSCSLRSTR